MKRFLKKVLREQALVRETFAAKPIHDLRVALRRCRSLAEGLGVLDDHRDWRRLQRTAKDLQDELAGLRDVQVMEQRLRRFGLQDGPARYAVNDALRRDERKALRRATRATKQFSRKRWRKWQRRLPKRAARLDVSAKSFAHLALQRVHDVSARERRWRESGSESAAHRMRIAVKQFRYTVQSFLPRQYAAWEKNLMHIQDALGELHDLDVLRDWLRKVAKKASLDHACVQEWMKRIADARRSCVERYRRAATIKRKRGISEPAANIVWDRWRKELETLSSANFRSGATVSE